MTRPEIGGWYRDLIKAPWTPPSWVFSPVWIILYLLMAIAVWLVYQTNTTKKKHVIAYVLFFSQLLFNGFWSFLFFYFHLIGWALLDLILLVVLVLMTTIHFFHINKIAGVFFTLYFVWIFYALSLNCYIWMYN